MENLLDEFFNSQSDASNLEASQQEELQKRFQEWLDNRKVTFEQVAEPLMKYLAENHHPHVMAEVECNRAILWEGQKTHVTDKFIVD